jgi:hypothetical protein
MTTELTSHASAPAFAWPPAGGRESVDDGPLGDLPLTGPLAEFAAAAIVLSRPADPTQPRPWVLALGKRVVKAYDLRLLEPVDRARALAEADLALSVSDVNGVVTTFRAEQLGSWLVIEMERLGESLADHMRGPPPAERAIEEWGRLFADVARALDELHRRRLIHRDVKPANLMFDRAGEQLVVGDFSIASRFDRRSPIRHSRPAEPLEVWGTDRYIAPEQFRGRLGYAADQYALAVTALDVLPDSIPAAAHAALQRATSHDPEDRFPTTLEFGAALRSGLDEKAPGRISSRLQRVSPKWRHTWGPGAAAAAGIYATLLVTRPAGLDPQAGLLLPLYAAGLVMVVARAMVRLRGQRTQPRVRIADRGWFPVVVFGAVFAAGAPMYSTFPQLLGKVAIYGGLGSLALAAVLGSMPRHAGEWLIRRVRRWEQWRHGHRGRPLAWWGGRVALLAMIAVVSLVPVGVSAVWPNESPPTTADGYAPLREIAALRARQLAGQAEEACRHTHIPAGPDIVPCVRWSPLAARWLRAEARAGVHAFRPDQLADVRVSYNDGSERVGAPTWSLRLDGGDFPWIGTMSRETSSGDIVSVTITRRTPKPDPLSSQEAIWRYDVVKRAGRWRVNFVEVCGAGSDRCARLSQSEAADLAAAARRGPPR